MHDQTTSTTHFDAAPIVRRLSFATHDHRQMVFSALHRIALIGPIALHQMNEATAISLRIATPKHNAIFGTMIQQVQSLI